MTKCHLISLMMDPPINVSVSKLKEMLEKRQKEVIISKSTKHVVGKLKKRKNKSKTLGKFPLPVLVEPDE